jgi:uncharacterized protein YcbX
MPSIQSIYRYPIKGLSPEALSRVWLSPGEAVPGDRIYAIENGPSGFHPVTQPYRAKTHFLMLMKNERLAALRTDFDHATHVLTILPPSPGLSPPQADAGQYAGTHHVRADLQHADGRAAVESYFADYCADELRGPPKVLHAPGHSFSDVARKVVSIINLASVNAIENMVGAPVDPLRFRANVYAEGWPPLSELELVGQTLAIGPHARLKVVKRIVRCAATNVDPQTGIRDLEIPPTLMLSLGHANCGIYAEVVKGGEIAEGDEIETV